MGYIHDSAMRYFVPPSLGGGSGGTWTHENDATYWTLQRAAGAGTFYLCIPVAVPHQNANENRGSRVASVDIYYKISNANLTSLAAEFNLQPLPATAEFEEPSNPAFSYDTSHDAAGERNQVGSHVMTLTLTTAIWLEGDEYLWVNLVGVDGGTSVFEFAGAKINYTLRV